MRDRRAVVSAAVGAIAALAGSFLLPAASQGAPPPVGGLAPDFTVTSLTGARVRLSDLRGKVVFVNLWATWCPPCREEIPSMVRLYEMFRGQDVEIVAVSQDRDPEAVRKFIRANRVMFPVALDEDKRVYRLYGATGVPETHLIDRKGFIRGFQMGPFDWAAPAVAKTVRDLLSK